VCLQVTCSGRIISLVLVMAIMSLCYSNVFRFIPCLNVSDIKLNSATSTVKCEPKLKRVIGGIMLRGVGVQSAAVNVICELARKNPKNYLSLAPLFFKLMTSSTNNWVLIKIIKLVCASPLSHYSLNIELD